jgi:hypothetical protein
MIESGTGGNSPGGKLNVGVMTAIKLMMMEEINKKADHEIIDEMARVRDTSTDLVC